MNKQHEGSAVKTIYGIIVVVVASTLSILLPLTIKSQSLPSAPNLLPGQTATKLANGSLLLLGGESVAGGLNVASIWNPRTGSVLQLPATMSRARAWHTATVLPDGLVLIFGGVGNNKEVVSTAELFDPGTQTFTNLPSSGVTPRARHTATLLSDGQVLIAGGVGNNGQALPTAELWDAVNPSSVSLSTSIIQRRDHTATLLADGQVLLWGGTDGTGNPLNNGDLFDPTTGHFTALSAFPSNLIAQSTDSPLLVASIPLDRSVDVDTETMISLRFSKALRVETVNAETVSLSGPKGLEKISVVSAENGSLAFITPEAHLLRGATYTVTVNGAIDGAGLPVPVSGISFSTAPALGGTSQPTSSIGSGVQTVGSPQPLPVLIPQSFAEDGWIWRGKLKDGKPHSDWEDLPRLQAPPGVTALSGQVLDIQGLPLAHVTLRFASEYGGESKAVQTDDTGRFLLTGIKSHWGELIIDGRQGRIPNSEVQNPKWGYGVYKYRAYITKSETNFLHFTIWLTKIDATSAVKIASPTTSEVVVTSPRIPGLELRLPPTAEITDIEGKRVDELSLTKIPLDRTPFPLPENVNVQIYFTAQPGGAYIKSLTGIGARIHYPNLLNANPGFRFPFWHYDTAYKGWYRYGMGTVSENGTQVIPDPGISFYELTGAMVGGGGPRAGSGPKCRNDANCRAGDPVDLQSGLFVHEKTDLSVPDIIPINITRTYRNEDTVIRPFGRGTNHPYDIFLTFTTVCFCYQSIVLVLPDGGEVWYDRISPGGSFFDAEFEATKSPTFYKSRVKWNGTGWDLTFKDGSVWVFPEEAPLQSMRDRYGNTTYITRSNGTLGNIQRVVSPSGRYVEFTHDPSNRITQIKDNLGRTVTYEYDASSRIWRVTDPMKGITEYTYDTSHRMLTLKDPRGIVYLTNEYTNGKVTKQTQADGSTYQFAYTTDASNNVIRTDVTDPRGFVKRVEFNTDGHLTKVTSAVGQPEEQVLEYERQAGTNLLLSLTDALEITPGVRRKTTYTYDGKGNMLTVTRMAQDSPANQVTTTYEYEPAFNQLKKIIDPLQHATEFFYDSFGNLERVRDPNNNETTYTYNPQGQPITVSTPAGTTQFVYEFGDLVSVIDPMGNMTNRGLDTIGRLQSTTNALGLATTYSYDDLNRMTAATDPLNGITQFGHDSNGNLLSASDAKAPTGVTGYSYNNMDRLETRTDPLQQTESYIYDPAGNLTLFRDRKQQATTYAYDALNRRTNATYADGSSTTYTYDKANRLTQINDSLAGTITRIYDGLDRLTSEQTLQGMVGYTYDAASRRATMTVPGQALISYTYDNANRLTQITQGSSIVQFGYDTSNRRTSLTLPNGILVEYGYDAASRVTSITYKQNGTTSLGELTYEYDKAGNRTKVGGTWARTGMPEPITATNYDANNRQLTFGDKILAYDHNGNLQSITDSNGTTLYSWNARNQLVAIAGPTVIAAFAYDGFGRRQSKTINGSPTQFLYDGINPVQETSGATSLANILPGIGVDEFLTRTDVAAGLTSSFLTDNLGSPIAVTDNSGVLQTYYTYQSFGKTTATGASDSNSYQYTGRENDGTGLYYYRARYYHPELQRFISEDPIEFGGADINLFSYTHNNPVNRVDPEGLFDMGAAVGTATGTGLGLLSRVAAGVAGAMAGDLLFPDSAGEGSDRIPRKNSSKENCPDDEDDCKDRLSNWQIRSRGLDAHKIKREYIGNKAPISRYELCKCKSGEIAIRFRGCTGPIIRTGYYY